MKWTKIKSLMLCFLIVMNIFMLSILALQMLHNKAVPERVIKATVSVLKKSGFEINEDILPKSYYNRNSYKAQFYSASDLSELFFDRQIAFKTVDKNLIAEDGNATLTVNENHFLYESSQEGVETESVAKLKRILKQKGFDMKGAVYDEEKNCFYKMYNNSNLFNMSMEAKLDKDGQLCYVSAQWPKELTPGDRKKISFIDSTMKLKETFPEGGNLQNIELGYSLRKIGENKFEFIPTWRVKVDNELRILEY